MVRTRSSTTQSGKRAPPPRASTKRKRKPAQRQVTSSPTPSPSPPESPSPHSDMAPIPNAQSLSNFLYYRRNGEPINIDVRMGSLLGEHCDAIAFTVNESLNLNAPLPSKVLSRTGVATAVKKDLSIAKKAKKYLAGDVAAVDLVDSDNNNNWKSLFFVVMPLEPTLVQAYKNILRQSNERQHTSIAIMMFISGQFGISPKTSAASLIEALIRFDREENLNYLKSIAILDLQRDVVKSFISKLHYIVEDHEPFETNSEKLVFVSDDNLLDYEARRLTSSVEASQKSEGDCVICMCSLQDEDEVCALKCDHQYHLDCFKNYLKQCTTRKCCPVCRKYFSIPCGNQPEDSTMQVSIAKGLGLEGCDTQDCIVIFYSVPSGIQDSTHLRPGLPYRGTNRYAYLPDNEEGRKVLRLLKKAFECRLIFTVGDSVTTGQKNVVTWNNIHHKTNTCGGPSRFGYPDETYFVRVRAELEEAGVTEDLLGEEDLQELVLPASTDF